MMGGLERRGREILTLRLNISKIRNPVTDKLIKRKNAPGPVVVRSVLNWLTVSEQKKLLIVSFTRPDIGSFWSRRDGAPTSVAKFEFIFCFPFAHNCRNSQRY